MKRGFCFLLSLVLLFSCAFAEVTDSSARAFLTALMAGDQDDALFAQFDDTMQNAFPKAQLALLWGQMRALGGEFVGFHSETVAQVEAYSVHAVHMLMTGNDLTATVTYDQNGKIAGLFVSPAPEIENVEFAALSLPDGATETEVVIGKDTQWALPGTLTLPKDAGAPVPAVLLVHGSGPNDRDETIGRTKMFRDLAYALAEAGIASLRYDKRTLVYGEKIASSEDYADFSVYDEMVDDALAAAALLRADDRIANIYLCGHSLGAMLAPEIARLSGGAFSGMLLLCGSPRTLLEVVAAQQKELAGEESAELQGGDTPYFNTMPTDMPAALLDLALPTLILNGGADFQVRDAIGMDAWREALGERDFVDYKHYPNLNHLLMRYTGDERYRGTVSEYATPALLDAAVARDIIDWISTTEKEQNGL